MRVTLRAENGVLNYKSTHFYKQQEFNSKLNGNNKVPQRKISANFNKHDISNMSSSLLQKKLHLQ
jgi:hypothetical protein